MKKPNKLECFTLEKTLQHCVFSKVRLEPTKVEHLDPLLDMLMSLSENITLGWKGFPGTNTLTNLIYLNVTKTKV
jgi:hypothetical protein